MFSLIDGFFQLQANYALKKRFKFDSVSFRRKVLLVWLLRPQLCIRPPRFNLGLDPAAIKSALMAS